MMRLFPISSPTLALSISEEALCLVEIKKQWRTSFLRQVTRVPLPRGIVKLSSTKPNIENEEEFLVHFTKLTERYTRPLPIALSLPDLCARASVFDFSTFPTKKQEQTALVNWRFQQDLKLETAQSRLAFGVYMPTSVSDSPSPGNPNMVRILGTIVRNDIVEQYEKMCLEARLIPTSVGISGLDIFDLYRPNIRDILKAENQPGAFVAPGAMFLFISHWGLTFLAFQEGTPRFIRTKAIVIKAESSRPHGNAQISTIDEANSSLGEPTQIAQLSKEPVSQNPSDMDTSKPTFPSYTAMKVGKEILATLQYFLETFPIQDTTSPTVNVFVATDLNHGHSLMPPIAHIQHTLKASGGKELHIRVTELSHDSHLHLKETGPESYHQKEAALPGYASLLVA
jgi:hypothetical protein